MLVLFGEVPPGNYQWLISMGANKKFVCRSRSLSLGRPLNRKASFTDAYLTKSYGRKISLNDDGHFHLAIDQARAYLNRPSKPLYAFLPSLKRIFKTALSKKPTNGGLVVRRENSGHDMEDFIRGGSN
jgi:hypothetical protein